MLGSDNQEAGKIKLKKVAMNYCQETEINVIIIDAVNWYVIWSPDE